MKFIVLLLLTSFISVYAQQSAKPYIENEIKRGESLLKASTSKYNSDESIDIKYYKLNINVSSETETIEGNVTIKAAPSLSEISSFFLDLYDALTVDSIVYQGQNISFEHEDDIITITLPHSYSPGDEFEVEIYYGGVPGSSGFGSFEFRKTSDNSPAIFTLSEPYGASDWWPCKNSPADKADSADIWITCSNGLTAISNGSLQETVTNNGMTTFKWKSSYPIAHYLISLAIANYTEYKKYFKYTLNDSMSVVHYMYPGDLDTYKNNLDQTVRMLEIFTEKFGEYPFIKEKYGHAQFGWGGGMEHQTISSMGSFGTSIIAHELAHQWFGDKITCRDWHHIWLNEGFASYAEGIYTEAVGGTQSYNNYIANEMQIAMNASNSVYVEDISSIGNIFNGASTYSKGGLVLHMLRGITGDSIFFEILKAYVNDSLLTYGTAVTEDFQRVAESIYGSPLNYFFQEWVYGKGYPSYNLSWNYVETSPGISLVTVSLSQMQGSLFTMPLNMKIFTSLGDTTISVFNDTQNQTFHFSVNGIPSSLVLDPDNYVLKSSAVTSVSEENVLSSFSLEQNYPNPFNPSTSIKFSIGISDQSYDSQSIVPVELKIYDALGTLVTTLLDKQLIPGNYEVEFDGADYSSGVYIYELKSGEFLQSRKMLLLK